MLRSYFGKRRMLQNQLFGRVPLVDTKLFATPKRGLVAITSKNILICGLSVLLMLPWWPQPRTKAMLVSDNETPLFDSRENLTDLQFSTTLHLFLFFPPSWLAETLPTLTSSSRFFFCCWNWPAWLLLWFYTEQSAATCWIVFTVLHCKVPLLLLWWQHGVQRSRYSTQWPNGALRHRTSGLFHTAALHLHKEPHDIEQLQQPSIHWSQVH